MQVYEIHTKLAAVPLRNCTIIQFRMKTPSDPFPHEPTSQPQLSKILIS